MGRGNQPLIRVRADTGDARREFRGFAQDANRALGVLPGPLGRIGGLLTGPGGVAAGLAAVGLAGGLAIRSAAEYETALVKLETQLGLTRGEVAGLRGDIDALSVLTGRSAVELANASFAIQSAGLRGEEGLAALDAGARGAAVGLGTARDVGLLSASAIGAYGSEAFNAAENTNILLAAVRAGNLEAPELTGNLGQALSVAAELGIGFDELAASVAFYTTLGVSAAESTTAVRATMNALLNPGQQALDILEGIGESVESVRDRLERDGLIQTLQHLRRELSDDEQAFTRVIGNIRGLGFALAATSDESGPKALQTLKDVQEAAGGVEFAFARASQTIENEFNAAQASASTALRSVGDALRPLATDLLGTFADALNSTFQDPQVQAVQAYNAAVNDLRIEMGELANTDIERARIAVESIFTFLAEGRDDPAVFGEFVRHYKELGAADAAINALTDTPRLLEQTKEQLLGIGDVTQGGGLFNVRSLLPDIEYTPEEVAGAIANIQFVQDQIDSLTATDRQGPPLPEERRLELLEAYRQLLADQRGITDPVVEDAGNIAEAVNLIYEELGLGEEHFINWAGVFHQEGRSVERFAQRLAPQIAELFDVEDDDPRVLTFLRALGLDLRDTYDEADRTRRGTIELNRTLGLGGETFQHVGFAAEGYATSLISVKDATEDAEEEGSDLGVLLSSIRDDFLEAGVAAEAYATSLTGTPTNYAAIADAARRYREALTRERGEIMGVTDAERERERATLDAIRAQQDAYRELGRIGRQTYETIADAIDDERRVSRRGFEDRRFELEREFDLELAALRSDITQSREEIQFAERILRGRQRAQLRSLDRQGVLADRGFEDRLENESDELRVLSQFVADTVAGLAGAGGVATPEERETARQTRRTADGVDHLVQLAQQGYATFTAPGSRTAPNPVPTSTLRDQQATIRDLNAQIIAAGGQQPRLYSDPERLGDAIAYLRQVLAGLKGQSEVKQPFNPRGASTLDRIIADRTR